MPRAQPLQRERVRRATPTGSCPSPRSRCTRPKRRSPSSSTRSSTLGFKAVLLAGYVQRPVGAVADAHPELAPWCTWIDMYGIDSAYDYDPVWQKCATSAWRCAFHSGSIGWGSRRSISNYMYNHIGHLAEGQHALCKSLFLGGVTRRFPELNFAFLEGGVAWAAALLSDLVGHWEKRNRDALRAPRPGRRSTRRCSVELIGEVRRRARPRTRSPCASAPPPRIPATARRVRGVRHRAGRGHRRRCSSTRFFFGCEADDPHRRARRSTPRSTRSARGSSAMFGSDVAHWDVPDMSRGARGSVGDGRPRLDRRGRLPRLRVRQPGALLHRREPRRSSPAPSSSTTSTRSSPNARTRDARPDRPRRAPSSTAPARPAVVRRRRRARRPHRRHRRPIDRRRPTRTIDADGLVVAPGLRRPPHALRRAGAVGPGRHAVAAARRHHGASAATAGSRSRRSARATSTTSSA